jgi:hypothetical protein
MLWQASDTKGEAEQSQKKIGCCRIYRGIRWSEEGKNWWRTKRI